MFPFALIARIRHRRRYKAALAVLLGMHAYERLSPKHQALVEEWLADWHRRFSEYPYSVVRSKMVTPFNLAAMRAWAMARLGFGTGVEGVSWGELLPLSRGRLSGPGIVALAFQQFHPATGDAVAFLEQRGVRFDPSLGLGPEWLAAMKAKYP
ncbi:hypothetical protein AACH06_29815 [Ideonella sp. DXS29W]|uniref:Uncharacterized protein n=1 Tax=Ideonella lacteola TaxID=2984193 RepID=A0ABU9BYH2_9BURK